jgi:hypothetical protein
LRDAARIHFCVQQQQQQQHPSDFGSKLLSWTKCVVVVEEYTKAPVDDDDKSVERDIPKIFFCIPT